MSPHDESDPRNTTNTGPAEEAGIEALLRQVGARAEPSEDLSREVRESVYAEWQVMVGERRRRRRIVGFGMVAGFALAVSVALFGVQRMTTSGPAQIATIALIDGQLIATSEDDQSSVRSIGQQVFVGETVQTDARSRAALTLPGDVSLRLDRNTRVSIAATDRIVLDAGALYIDSPKDSNTPPLSVQARDSSVQHVGTQYEVRTQGQDVEINVREGRVIISHADGESTGRAGESIHVSPGGRITRNAISASDPAWDWVSAAAPAFDINDRPLSSYLQWFARETGRQLIYASSQAETAAAQGKLRGSIEGLDPDTALTTVLSTTQLRQFPTREGFIGITLQAADDRAAR